MSKRKETILRLKLLATALACVPMVSACNRPSTSFGGTMYGVYENTCFDEMVGDEFVKEISRLEEYINISDKLNKLDLVDNTNTNNYLNCYLGNSAYLNALIDDYENKNYDTYSKDELNALLYVQNKLVNEYIYHNGYDIMASATLNCLKARIADASGLSVSEAKKITVMDKKTYDQVASEIFPSIFIGEYDISKCDDLLDLLNSVYEMQSNDSKVSHDEFVSYNKDRNKIILKAINNLKNSLVSEYKIDSKKRIKNK